MVLIMILARVILVTDVRLFLLLMLVSSKIMFFYLPRFANYVDCIVGASNSYLWLPLGASVAISDYAPPTVTPSAVNFNDVHSDVGLQSNIQFPAVHGPAGKLPIQSLLLICATLLRAR